jgi:hypothetical protein
MGRPVREERPDPHSRDVLERPSGFREVHALSIAAPKRQSQARPHVVLSVGAAMFRLMYGGVLRWLLPMALALTAGSLVAVDIASFARNRPLRTGSIPPSPSRFAPERVTVRSSGTTHLAWVTGALLTLIGWLHGAHARVALALIAAGGLVAITGWFGRVSGFELSPNALTVRYVARRPFDMAWADCRALRPPRAPPSGWRIETPAGARTLMPSDVLGREALLELIVRRAGMRYEGRRG